MQVRYGNTYITDANGHGKVTMQHVLPHALCLQCCLARLSQLCVTSKRSRINLGTELIYTICVDCRSMCLATAGLKPSSAKS